MGYQHYPYHLASKGRQEFFRCVRETMNLLPHQLVAIAICRHLPIRVRAAALRNLTCEAPLHRTQGRPYAERRRIVRKYYKI